MANKPLKAASTIGIALAFATSLYGCVSPKAANNANFANAINTYYANPEHCASIQFAAMPNFTDGNFPVTVNSGIPLKPVLLDAMVKDGVLTSRPVKNAGNFGGPGTEYSIAPSAKDAVRVVQVPAMLGTTSVVCVGRYVVKSVEKFTEPTERQGMTVSGVKFTRVVQDSPTWVSNKTVRDAADGRLDFTNKATVGMKLLVLTNKGWEVGE